MAERLYSKFVMRDGRKLYAPTIHAKHRTLLYRKASDAQAHSMAVRTRYERLKAAARA